MKVIIDQDLCRGCGVCESIAQEIFILGDELTTHVKMDTVPERMRVLVEEAIAECPEGAIRIIEDE